RKSPGIGSRAGAAADRIFSRPEKRSRFSARANPLAESRRGSISRRFSLCQRLGKHSERRDTIPQFRRTVLRDERNMSTAAPQGQSTGNWRDFTTTYLFLRANSTRSTSNFTSFSQYLQTSSLRPSRHHWTISKPFPV